MARRRPLDEENEAVKDSGDEQETQCSPSAKRARVLVEQDYKKGTVKKIRVHDFMTYAGTVTITPGPRLNLLLGPNGTGKSSLVCALCVGLAGSTKLLGRADNLADYVRRNCNSCWTEITLSGGSNRPDLVIRRNISVEYYTDADNTRKRSFQSDFRINSKYKRFFNYQHATQEEVKEKVKSLNIQFDNLCQFLPQDKVVEFAKMNPQELLVATEKALGDSALYNTHMELIEMRNEAKTHEGELARVAQRLGGLEQEQQRQQRDYERYENRERLKKQAEVRRSKVLWLRVEQAMLAKRAADKALKEAAKVFEKLCSKVQKDQGPVRALDKEFKDAERAHIQTKDSVDKARHALLELTSQVEKTKEHLEEMLTKRQNLKNNSEKHKTTIANLSREVTELQQKLESLPHGLPQEKKERSQALAKEMREASTQLQAMQEEDRDKKAQLLDRQSRINNLMRRDQQLSTTGEQRFRILEEQYAPKAKALKHLHDWITENKHRFQGPVYGPAFLDINVHKPTPNMPGSQYWAAYVEKQCSNNLNNFVMSCKADEEVISSYIRGQQWEHFIVLTTVTHAYNQPLAHNYGNASDYKQYGITHTLDEVFDAPQLVKHMLADLSGITSAFVGGEDTKAMSDQLFRNEARVRNVYAGEVRMTYSVSRYNKEATTTQVDGVRPARILSGESLADVEAERQRLAADIARLQQEKTKLQEEVHALESGMWSLKELLKRNEQGLDQLAREQEGINQQHAKAQSDLTIRRNRLDREQAKPDPLDEEPVLHAQCQQVLQILATLGGQMTSKVQAYWTALKKCMYAELVAEEKKQQCAAARQQADAQQKEKDQAAKAKELATRQATLVKANYDKAKADAEAQAPLTEEAKAAMQDLCDDIGKLEEEADDFTEQAAAIKLNDEGVVREYETRKRKIDELKKQVDDLAKGQQQRDAALETKKASWLPELKSLVGLISDKFSINFQEIGCAGEVELQEDVDFDKFAINIRVKFRDHESMQLLTATRQSGGERSVSTILYLIALQGITETPFRVVDEINQGMDPVNERKVFIQLVESSCKPDTPQCFLLTPKLLPGLPFEPQISVLTIMNGAGVPKELIKHYSNNKQLSVLLGSRIPRAVTVQ